MYKLPNKHNDVVEDIEQLAVTLQQIDEDICSVGESAQNVSDLVDRLSGSSIQAEIEDGEIRDIAPNRFLTVNSDGDGFTCVEGGGASGGITGQCNLKKSDASFDVAYGEIFDIAKDGTVLKANDGSGQCGQCHIFSDDNEINNDESLPKNNVINQQINGSFESLSNESVIISNNIELSPDTVDLATKANYGLVKAGDGVTVADGVISAKEIKNACKSRFGIVKAGNGIEIADGTISAKEILKASSSNFGVVKLGREFQKNADGAMELADMADAEIIYKLCQSKAVFNGNIDLEEKTLIYRVFVSEDIVFSFNFNFEPKSDMSFILEIVSDGTHLIHFSDKMMPISQNLTVNRGTTRMSVTKKLGVPFFEVVVSRLDCPKPQLLTPRNQVLISDNFRVTTPKGCGWIPWEVIRDYVSGEVYPPCVRFEFTTLVCVDYVKYMTWNREHAMTEFSVKASVDGKNWTTLIYKTNEIIEEKVYTDVKGCFRIFEINLGYTNEYNALRGITLWGTQIDNNESEITLLTPYMSSNIGESVTMTANNITRGSASDLTDTNCNSLLRMDKTGDDWIKYEFTEAKTANVLELHFRGTGEYYGFYGDRHPNWFKLEGSNDDENWTLLLERSHLGSYWAYDNNVVFFDFKNETAYKYYKFTCLGTNSTAGEWGLSGFKLYQQSIGKHNINRGVPKLSSANQDGYEITASSQCDGGHAGYLAFDDNMQTRWASAANEGNSWLQVKLPTAMAFNAVKIAPRGDGYLDQAPSTFQIQGSNDGENWDVLDSETGISWSTLGELRVFLFENETAYLYYRLYITANQGSAYNGCSCFILGRTSYDYKRNINQYVYIVPTMTSDTTSGSDGVYKLSSSTEHSSHKRIYLFDRRFDTRFELSGETSGWIQVELPAAKTINAFSIGSRSDDWCSAAPRDYTLHGSNNGTSWTQLFSVSNSSTFSRSELRTHNLNRNVSYKFYKLNIANPNSSVLTFARWDLFEKKSIQEY